jgi:anti-sigma factor RsiW
MRPIDPAELSAYLDGELSEERAAEIRLALSRDASLRQSYERLAALDADCKTRAEAAMFRPRVQFATGIVPGRYLAAAIVGLLVVRLVLKASPPLFAAAVAALLLVLFIGWGLRRIVQITDTDGNHSQLAVC